MENLYGIPGTLGGAIRGNAGAFGSQISDFVESVTILNIKNLKILNLKKQKCNFKYRSSLFKQNHNLIIVSAKFNLTKGNIKKSQKLINKILQQRNILQDNQPSAGCIFKNIKNKNFIEFTKNNPDLKLPRQFLLNKAISSACLIDQCNLKNIKINNAKVSDKHANFIINTGNANAKDVIKLINLIKTKVKDKFQVQLQEEIQRVES